MTKEEYLEVVMSISQNSNHGISIFACVKGNDTITLKNFVVQERLENKIDELMVDTLKEKYITNDFDYESIDDIYDNKKALYYFTQNSEFSPLGFLENISGISDFTDQDQENLFGFAIRLNIDSKYMWLYQQVYPVSLIANRKLLYFWNFEGRYDQFQGNLYRIDKRIDIIIINNELFTSNISLLEKKFGFERYVRSEAKETIRRIEELKLVSDLSKIESYESKDKLTYARKLMKVKNSPVLHMTKERLISKIGQISRYRNTITVENEKIVIKTQKDVVNLLKLLNDDILKSELTEEEYESSTKNLLASTDQVVE